MTAACHEPGNNKPICIQLDRIEQLETEQGQIARDISTTRQIATRTLDEVVALRGEMRENEERRQRECDIRHKPIERRLDRLEDHDDTLTATSAVTMSDEALRRRYEELKSELVASVKAKQTATAAVEVERAKSKRAMWVAFPAIVVAVAGIVTSILQAMGK